MNKNQKLLLNKCKSIEIHLNSIKTLAYLTRSIRRNEYENDSFINFYKNLSALMLPYHLCLVLEPAKRKSNSLQGLKDFILGNIKHISQDDKHEEILLSACQWIDNFYSANETSIKVYMDFRDTGWAHNDKKIANKGKVKKIIYNPEEVLRFAEDIQETLDKILQDDATEFKLSPKLQSDFEEFVLHFSKDKI